MAERAEGTFEIGTWEEAPYDEREGTRLSRTLVIKTFRGAVEGESKAELLMAYGAEEGSAAYAGMERVVGSVDGRSGSFVLSHSATMERGEGRAKVVVVPGSGTGELRGLRGEDLRGAGRRAPLRARLRAGVTRRGNAHRNRVVRHRRALRRARSNRSRERRTTLASGRSPRW